MTTPVRVRRVRVAGQPGYQWPDDRYVNKDAAPNGLPIVYVGRGNGRLGKWGNPFSVVKIKKRFELSDRRAQRKAVSLFRRWMQRGFSPKRADNSVFKESNADPVDILYMEIGARMRIEELPKLTGKNLACWCAFDQPCHADILIEFANKETE